MQLRWCVTCQPAQAGIAHIWPLRLLRVVLLLLLLLLLLLRLRW